MEKDLPVRQKERLLPLLDNVGKALASGPLMGAYVFADDGPLLVHLGEKVGWKRIKLRDNASEPQRAAFNFLVKLRQLIHETPDDTYRLMVEGLLTGLMAGKYVGQLHNHRLNETVARLTEHRVKGGKATAKWTPEVEQLARSIFADVKRQNVSNDAAYRRTVARLKASHGISISRSTLQRGLNGSPNAQR